MAVWQESSIHGQSVELGKSSVFFSGGFPMAMFEDTGGRPLVDSYTLTLI